MYCVDDGMMKEWAHFQVIAEACGMRTKRQIGNKRLKWGLDD